MIARKVKISFAAAAVAVLAAAGIFKISFSHAQTQEADVFITWHAETYVPPQYAAKALPVSDSKILLAVDVVDSGKIADLSSYAVIWYLNDKLLAGGLGVNHADLTTKSGSAGSILNIRVEIPDYQGGVLNTIKIPVVSPQASIETPSRNGRIQSFSFTAKAHPYFFNVESASQLNMAWTLNGQSPQGRENPAILNVNIDSADAAAENRLSLGLSINNPDSSSERAGQSVTLVFSP